MENGQYTPEQTEQRRNETLRQMLSTPPQQHASHHPQTAKSRKKAALDDRSTQTEMKKVTP